MNEARRLPQRYVRALKRGLLAKQLELGNEPNLSGLTEDAKVALIDFMSRLVEDAQRGAIDMAEAAPVFGARMMTSAEIGLYPITVSPEKLIPPSGRVRVHDTKAVFVLHYEVALERMGLIPQAVSLRDQ